MRETCFNSAAPRARLIQTLGRLVEANIVTHNNSSISLWRGALGGLLGNLVKLALIWFIFTLIYPKRLGYFDNTTTLLLFAIMGIPSAAIMGVIVAAVIRAVNLKTGLSIGIIVRAVTGAGTVFALWVVIVLYDKYFPEMNRWSIDNVSTWIIMSLFKADAGLMVGVVAGVLAGRKQNGIESGL